MSTRLSWGVGWDGPGGLAVMTFFLRLVREGAPDDIIRIDDEVATIGSGDEADVTLATKRLAPEHVEIRREGEVLWVRRTARGRRFPGALSVRVDEEPLRGQRVFRPGVILALGEEFRVSLARAGDHPESGALAQSEFLAGLQESADRGERVELSIGVDCRLVEIAEAAMLSGQRRTDVATLMSACGASILGVLFIVAALLGEFTSAKSLVSAAWGVALLPLPLITWLITRPGTLRVPKRGAQPEADTYRGSRSVSSPTLGALDAIVLGGDNRPGELFVRTYDGVRYIGTVPGADATPELDFALSRLAGEVRRTTRGIGVAPALCSFALLLLYIISHAATFAGNSKSAFFFLHPGALVLLLTVVLPIVAISEWAKARHLLNRSEDVPALQVRVEPTRESEAASSVELSEEATAEQDEQAS